MSQHKENWGSRIGMVLAVAGNAVGLGNFLRFPAQAVANGGGAFIIPYLVSFLLMGIPLLWIEWAIGRHGGRFGHHSTPGAMQVLGKSLLLKYVGVFGIFSNLTIAAYYCYIESWTLAYVWYSITGVFAGMSPGEVSHFFSWYLASGDGHLYNVSSPAVVFFAITVVLNLYILSRGLSKGVELASKIGMPILIIFGIFLTIMVLNLRAGDFGAINDAMMGLNFLWTPQFDSLSNPKVWLAAAGQIFFTLSVGMGSIQCYAAYVRERDDIALNASAAGWMNEFVEVILGGSIIVPIAVAYLGLDWLKANVGFEMGFRTIPTLFQHWGPVLAAIGGVAWFGLLFFAGITSSLAMGQPVMAYLQDEFHVPRTRSALMFGAGLLILAIPCMVLYEGGAFAEYDYWVGTFSLFIFALVEAVVFAWVFGIDKAWHEINLGADMRVPRIYKHIIKFVTPTFLLAVFVGAVVKPTDGEWVRAITSMLQGNGWGFAADSVIGTIIHEGVSDLRWFVDGHPTTIFIQDATRVLLMLTFLAIAWSVHVVFKRRKTSSEGGAA